MIMVGNPVVPWLMKVKEEILMLGEIFHFSDKQIGTMKFGAEK